MNRTEIIESVKSYIQNPLAKYALLINGQWGAGKTFLYENHLIDAISSCEEGRSDAKTNIYISLYGISSVEALSKQLLTNYLIYVKADGNGIVKKTAKPLAGILGIVSKAISFSAGPLSINLQEFQNIFDLFKTKDMVVCLDDMERCSIPITELLGFVNNLIEHCNCKVLILADERNIGKTYANTNIEQKYQTLLTGNRKVIQGSSNDRTISNNNPDELTIKQLKEFNESLFSENFIYLDIKKKS